MAGRREYYIGRSGQLVVMAEFLRRGYNAAIPEIDMGEDIFVIEDATGKLSRIQVKSAIGKGKNNVYAIFTISQRQLEVARLPDLWYVLTVYHNGLWREFLVLPRKVLLDLYVRGSAGRRSSRGTPSLTFYIAFHKDDVRCGGTSLQQYRDNWSQWPEIIP